MLVVSHLSLRFGAQILFKEVSLQFNPKRRYGIVGANGSGKSTFTKVLTGDLMPDAGTVTLPSQESIGALSQDHYRFAGQKIIDIVIQGNKKLWSALEKKEVLLEKGAFTSTDCDDLTQLERAIEEEKGYAAEACAAKLLEGLGIKEELHKKPLEVLSGGYKLRVLLAQVLFSNPSVLILDEPTNHLDLDSIKWLESYLKQFEGTLLLVSHDRFFLNAVCTDIADIDSQSIELYPGNFDLFEQKKLAKRQQQEQLMENQLKKCGDLQSFIDRFGAKATKASQAQSKAKALQKIEKEMEANAFQPSLRRAPELTFERERASGLRVLKVEALEKSFGTKHVLHQVSFEVEREEKIAIIGANGTGKSTLLEILTENLPCDGGSFAWGHAVSWGYFPQNIKKQLDPSLSLLEWLRSKAPHFADETLRDALGRVLFSGDTVHKLTSTLSGGEAARLFLAKLMLQKPNVLILDEPTNHLDLEAIEAFAEALALFEGTIISVSHNRYFVSQIANRIIEIAPKGIKDFRGSYKEYLEKENVDFLTAKTPSRSSLVEKKDNSLSQYEEQKKIKNLQAQKKKKIAQLEESCQNIEEQIKEIDQRFASPSFYLQSTPQLIQKLRLEKEGLEARLVEEMELWEKWMQEI